MVVSYRQDRNDEPLNDWPVDEENRRYCEYQGNQDQTRGIHDDIGSTELDNECNSIAKAAPHETILRTQFGKARDHPEKKSAPKRSL